MIEGAKEGVLTHRENSPTAANASNRLFGVSGRMLYRVQLQTSTGQVIANDVMASTGDEAAELGVADYLGAKVMHIAPAPQKPKKDAA